MHCRDLGVKASSYWRWRWAAFVNYCSTSGKQYIKRLVGQGVLGFILTDDERPMIYLQVRTCAAWRGTYRWCSGAPVPLFFLTAEVTGLGDDDGVVWWVSVDWTHCSPSCWKKECTGCGASNVDCSCPGWCQASCGLLTLNSSREIPSCSWLLSYRWKAFRVHDMSLVAGYLATILFTSIRAATVAQW